MSYKNRLQLWICKSLMFLWLIIAKAVTSLLAGVVLLLKNGSQTLF